MNRWSPAPRKGDLPAGGEEAEAGEDPARRQRERMEEAALLAAMPDSVIPACSSAAENLKQCSAVSKSREAVMEEGRAMASPLFCSLAILLEGCIYIRQVSRSECRGVA